MDVGDVDQDGDLDILIANDGLDKLYVNNTPVTSFAATEAVDIGIETNNAQQMDIGDVDNDGDMDVVIANEGTAELLLNNGTLEPFLGVSPVLISNKPSSPRSIKLADVNRDGLLDVMVGGAGASVRLTLNDGDALPFSGTVANQLTFAATESYVYSFAVGDVNNDGYPDVVLGKILLSTGDGIKTLYLHDKNIDADTNPYNSIAPISIGVAAQAFAMELADMNADGNLDLVVGHGNYISATSRINHLYLGNGSDTPFSAGATNITTDQDFTSQIKIADVNKDGALDIIVGNGFNLGGSASNMKVYLNDKSGDPFDTASGQIIGSDGLKATGLAVGDIDHDSNLDVVSVAYQSRRVMLYPITGNTAFANIIGSEVSEDSISSSAVAIADFNNDGDQDIFVAAAGVNRLYHNSAAAEAFNTVTDTSIDTSSYSTVPVNIGDFNGDGLLDVISGVWGQVNRLNINNGTRDPFNQASQALGSDALLTQALAVGDVNRDGLLDVVSGNNGANNLLHLNNGTATPFTGAGINISNVAETDVTRDLVLTDFNRDGYLDVIAGNQGNPLKIYFNNQNNLAPYGVAPFLPLGTNNYNMRVIRSVDIDNDGDPDIIVGNDSQDTTGTGTGTGSNTGGNFVLLNNGSGGFSAGYFIGQNSVQDKDDTYGLAFGDVDNDGDLDMIAGNFGQVNKLYINDGSTTPFINTIGTPIGVETDSSRVVVLDDLDQDGDLDLVVANVGGTDKYYLNNGTATPFDASSVAVALPNTANPVSPTSYGAVIGDIDNDGNNDIIVGDFGATGSDHFYRSLPFSLNKQQLVSKPVDTESDILKATLTVSETTSNNDRIDYFLTNNGGSYLHQVVPGVEFTFPTPGNDLHWKAVIHSLSPSQSSELSGLNITARFDHDLDLVVDDEDVCVGTSDPSQLDNDNDAVAGVSTGPANGGDACDADDDNDGVIDTLDLFPFNPLESADTDGDCVGNFNLPTSGNGCGDASDTDIDGDGLLNINDPFNFNIQPSISGIPATTATPDTLYNFQPVVSDGGDGPGLSASLTFEGGTQVNLPAWLSFNTATGQLSGLPSNDDYQTKFGNFDNVLSNIVISVNDGVEIAALAPFSITLQDTRAPNSIAVPAGGNFNASVDVRIFCLEKVGSGCSTIRYTTNDILAEAAFASVSASTTTVTIDSASGNTNLRFYSVDVAGNIGATQTETYNFDLDFPSVSILAPAAGALLNTLEAITGSSSDTGTGVASVQIQITDGFNSVLAPAAGLSAGDAVWLPVTTSDGYATWSYPRGAINWIPDTDYIINARVTDNAGNVTTASTSFTYYSGAPASTSLSLTLTSSAIPNNDTTDATLTFTRLNNTQQDQTGTALNLHIVAPDGTPTDIATTTNFAGQVTLALGTGAIGNISFNTPGQYTLQAQFAGNIQMAAVNSSTANLLVGSSAGYAVIVQGKLPNESGLESHNKTANRIYDTLKDRGFVDQDIFYFNFNVNQNGVDGLPTKAAIQAAIENLYSEIQLRPAPVYIIMVDHGGELVNGVNEATFYLGLETITPTELDSWLDTLEGFLASYDSLNATSLLADNKRVVIMGACYSGGFVPGVSAPGRIVISSASAHEQSYKGPTEDDGIRVGEYFLEELFLELADGSDLRSAFQTATTKTEAWTRGGDLSANSANGFNDDAVQHPLLDDNSDTLGTNAVFSNSTDGQLAKDILLGFNQDSLTNDAFNPADITRVTNTLYLDSNTSSAQLQLFANDPYQVNQAYVEIRTPDKTLSSTGNNTTEQLSNDFLRRAFTPPVISGAPYTLDYPDFVQSGQYEIFYYVNDRFTGSLSPARRSLVYKDRAPVPAPNQPPGSFTLLSPGATSWDGIATQKTILAFDWQDAVDADVGSKVTYTLQLADDPAFTTFSKVNNADVCSASSVIYQQQELTSSSTFLNETAGLCDDRSYYWKVIAVDEYGQHTFSTDSFIFHTNDTNAQIGTIVALVQSNVTSAQLLGANVSNQFGESGSGIAVVEYNGNYVILTSHVGEAQTISAVLAGYTVPPVNGVTVADRQTVEILISMVPAVDTDSDLDGVFDVNDNCPLLSNVSQADFDTDGQGDACDLDDDNDGMSDAYENLNGLNALNAADASGDPDLDGVSNLQEALNGTNPSVQDDIYFPDSDGDGVTDNKDNCLNIHNPSQLDTDTDGAGNACDPDDDGDGMPDEFELLYSLNPLLNDAAADADGDSVSNLAEFLAGTNPTIVNSDTVDTDLDGVTDVNDNCPGIANALQQDLDNDSVGDACDGDIDNDSVPNAADAFDYNPAESIDSDGDCGVADPNLSTSGNGCGNNSDNDDDGDGMSDAFEVLYGLNPLNAADAAADADGDGASNLAEFLAGTNPTIVNSDTVDTDLDGVTDVNDNCPGIANALQQDLDNDSVGDACDGDIDNDSVPNAADAFDYNPAESIDSDGDCGVADPNLSTSGNGCGNNSDNDDDGDGMSDAFELLYGLDPLNAADAAADADGDGITNLAEFVAGSNPLTVNAETIDTDADGVKDFLDNCVNDANAGQSDVDADTVGDACDADIDNDGVLNASDAFPYNALESADNDLDCIGDANLTTAGNGCGNNSDPDDDNDGMPDIFEAFYGLNVLVNDALGDADSDGVSNLAEYTLGTNPNVANSDTIDTDGDGVKDVTDNCTSIANADQADQDNDSIGDVCDSDRDGDGVANGADIFPDNANESADFDLDGIGDNADSDDDGDTMSDAFEILYGFNPRDASDKNLDPDNDGIDNAAEFTLQTNPLKHNNPQDTTDSDGDGVVDFADNCPALVNADQADLDADGVGNVCDSDRDNDNVLNDADAYPDDASESRNFDGDAQGDNADTDDDNDGMPDAFELAYNLNPFNAADASADSDLDGLNNLQEYQAGTNPQIVNSDTIDTDGDGVVDVNDNCVNSANPDQSDIDSDSRGDLCDSDRDGDNVSNSLDLFPDNPAESADNDGDLIGDNADTDDDNDQMSDAFENLYSLNPLDATDAALDPDGDGLTNLQEFQQGSNPTLSNIISDTTDSDGDTVFDVVDNCPSVANSGQADQDGDSVGDACDGDRDNDNVPNGSDLFPDNPAEAFDFDGDGIGDNADNDDDNDGMSDEFELLYKLNPKNAADANTDNDGDGLSNKAEFDNGTNPAIANSDTIDSDGDGIVDVLDNCPALANALQTDSDGDTVGDVCDSDRDNDNVLNANDLFPDDSTESKDFDGDGIGDNADLDDDNDGMSDVYELLYGLNALNPADAADDPDNDGFSNLQEFQNETSPKSSNAVVAAPASSGGGGGLFPVLWIFYLLLLLSPLPLYRKIYTSTKR